MTRTIREVGAALSADRRRPERRTECYGPSVDAQAAGLTFAVVGSHIRSGEQHKIPALLALAPFTPISCVVDSRALETLGHLRRTERKELASLEPLS